MALKSILRAKQWNIINSAPDGHCLLHSVRTSLKYQLKRDIDIEHLKSVVFTESINNVHKYAPAIGSKLTYLNQLNSYLIKNQYNHAFGDIVPNVLASGLNLRINILDVRGNDLVRETLIQPFDSSAISEIYIKLQNEHYDGIAPVQCYSTAPPTHASQCNDVGHGDVLIPPIELGDVLIPPNCDGDVLMPPNVDFFDLTSFDVATVSNVAPMSSPPPTDVETPFVYTRTALLQLRNASKPNRTIRRRVFYLGINRISHNPSPVCIPVPTCKWSTPSLLLTNPTSLTNKIDELHVIAKQQHSDIVAVCESWLTPEMPIEPYLLHGYHAPIRRERTGKRGGGVLCYVKDRFPMRQWNELCDPDVESIWLTVFPQRLPRQFSVISIGIIYHPPGQNHKNLTHHIQRCCDYLILKYPQTGIIIMGDLNEYKTQTIQTSYKLKQLVREPTFLTKTLDKILTNMHEMYSTPVVLAPIGSLDRGHCVVCCYPAGNFTTKTACVSSQIRDQRPANRTSLGEAIVRHPWHKIYRMPTCAEQFDFYQTSMTMLINKHLPWKSVSRSSNDPPWITDSFKNLVMQRNNAFRNKLNSYKYLKTEVRKAARSLKRKYYKQSVAELELKSRKQNLKWWDLTKRLTGEKGGCNDAVFKAMAQELCDGDIGMLAEKFNDTYIAVGENLEPLIAEVHQPVNDTQIYIEPHDVLRKLLNIDVRKAPGPDGVLSWILRDLADVLAGPLCSIFNTSLREGYVPQIWKSANIISLPKKPHPQAIGSDFRPISLLPVASKHMEFHIGRKIWDIIGPQIRPNQYGGLEKASCTLALIDLMYSLHSAAAEKKMARVLLIDYQKAFDLISHQLILHKLRAYRVPEILVNWVRGYLCNRQQRVRIGSHLSSWQAIRGGVPQGSWLGPVLFVLVIDDLDIEGMNLIKFMDDTTLTEISSNESKMQESITKIEEWTTANKMKLNAKKTKEMVIQFRRVDHPTPLTTSEGVQIEQVASSKLLGVTIQDNLKWEDHISDVTRKASRRIHFLIGLRRAGYEPNELLTYYTAYIRSVLEYAAVVFHPGLTCQQSEQLEMVQRRALGIIYPEHGYQDALVKANLQSLAQRRIELCQKLFVQMQNKEHRLNKLLPPLNEPSYNLRRHRKYSVNSRPSVRQSKEFVTFCIDNFNYV